jgi:anti-sigma factor RsiW
MSHCKSELVSAMLDGELRGWRRFFVVRHVQRCPICAAEYRHLRHVRQMLKANRPEVTMDDSAEFFWLKIKSEIEAREPREQRLPRPALHFMDWLGQHQAALASATAVIVVGLAAYLTAVTWRDAAPAIAAASPIVEQARTFLPDTVASVVGQEEPSVTVIWVSGLPWMKDMTELQTVTAHPYDYFDI